MGKITEVVPGEDYLVTVHFDNHHFVTIDMKSKLHTARFSELRDKRVFGAAQTDGKAVHWPGGISMSIKEIIEVVTR